MKISSAKLKQIIKEEIEALAEKAPRGSLRGAPAYMDDPSYPTPSAVDKSIPGGDEEKDVEKFKMDLAATLGNMVKSRNFKFDKDPTRRARQLNYIEKVLMNRLEKGLDAVPSMYKEALDPDVNASYEAAMDQLDLVMKGMSVDQVLNVVKDYLEVGDLEMIIRKMPSAEAEEIFDTLRKMSK